MTSVVEVVGARKSFGAMVAVDNVDMTLLPGKITGLIGPNGSGKSTLVDLMSGLQRLDAGEIRHGMVRLNRMAPQEIARLGVVRTFQTTRVFSQLTVMQNLLVASPDENRAAHFINFLKLGRVRDAAAGGLSYGQQKLVELGTVLMLNPKVILLDEPGAGINPALLDEVKSYIASLAESGIAILLVDHNVELIRELCSELIAMDAGRVVASGSPSSVLASASVQEAYLGGRR